MTFIEGKGWIVFLLIFLCFAGICLILFTREAKPVETNIKVAFPGYDGAASYDPVKIHFAVAYTFLADIYSPLVEYSVTGELVAAAAERFEWIGNEAHFTMRKDLKTIDGHEINAYDAERTFKRIFILGGNTHGNLKDMLCPDISMSSLNDACPGLEVRDNGRTFVMKLKERKIFLFPMLAAIDFAIIPRNSIDLVTLAIKDYRNTSGPYYVLKDSPDGRIELAANPRHFHYSEDIPQKATLVPASRTDMMEPLKMFSENKVDHILTIDKLPVNSTIEYAKGHKDVEVFCTYPMKVAFVIFTKKGRTKFSKEERFRIGVNIKRIFLQKYSGKEGYEDAEQVFPVLGEGALGDAELAEVKREREMSDAGPFNEGFTAWNVNMLQDFEGEEEPLRRLFPNGKFDKVRKVPGLVNYDKEKVTEPDFYLMWTDMGFQEEIGLLSYYNGADFFYWDGQDKADWLSRYMAVGEKKDRLKLLRKLHYQTLLNAAVIPIAKSTYTAMVRKPWKLDFSKLYGSNRLWRIHRR